MSQDKPLPFIYQFAAGMYPSAINWTAYLCHWVTMQSHG